MKEFRKFVSSLLIASLLYFQGMIYAIPVAFAAAPTVSSAKVTGANTITVVYSEAVNTIDGDYTSITVGGVARTVSNVAGSPGTTITITFSGGAAAAVNATGTMDIGTGVANLGSESFAGATQALTDGQAPTISQTTAVPSPTNNTTPSYTFTTDEAGTITYAGDCTSAGLASASVGANVATFDALAAGTHNNCTIKVTDSAGNQSNTLSVNSFTIDTTAPTITTAKVTGPNAITTVYSEAVTTVSGDYSNVTVGGVARNITNVSGSGTTTVVLTFDGAAAAVNATGTMDVAATVVDAAGNAFSAATRAITDNQSPVVAQVTAVPTLTNTATPSYTFSSTEAGTISYGGDCTSATTAASVGNNTVAFSALGEGLHNNCTVTVTDSASNASNTLSVNSFTVDTVTPTFTAIRTGLNTIVLTFNENVSASDTSATAWTVTGGTVTGATQPSNATTLTLTTSGITDPTATPTVTYVAANGTVVDAATNEVANGANTVSTDAVAPTVSSVTTAKADGSYKVGEVIDVTVTYTKIVNVTGTPALALNSGGSATYNSGTGTATLTFRYTVASSQDSSDLGYSATNSLTVTGATIRDAANNDADNTLPATTVFTGAHAIVIDTTLPATPTFTIATDNKVNNSEKAAITVAGTAEANALVSVTITDTAATAKVGSQQLTGGATSFSFNVDGTTATALIDGNLSVSVTATDAAGNVSNVGNVTVPQDTVAPSTPTVTLTNPINNSNKTATTLTVTGETSASVSYSINDVDGATPAVTGTGTLTGGSLTVNNLDLSSLSDQSITASVTVTDSAGNANTAGSAVSTKDVVLPTLSSVSLASNNATTTLAKVGDTVTVTFTASETISTPTVTFTSGAAAVAGSVTPTNTSGNIWTASYVTQTGDTTGAVAYSIAFSDSVGNAGVAVTSGTGSVTFDKTAPTVSSVTSTDANGSYKAAHTTPITITFSESVTVTGTPQLQLSVGGATRYADYASGSGTSTLTFNYVVQSGDTTSDLDYTATTALTLNSGTIKDAAGNAATLTLATPGAANSLGANKAIIIDTTLPAFSSITPLASSSINSIATTFGYTLSETITSGTVIFTRSGGTADASGHTCTLVGSSLTTGAHTVDLTDSTNTNNCTAAMTLVDGAIYDITLDGTDVAGNAASTSTVTGVTYDVTAPTAAITYSPNRNVKSGESLTITATFSEAVADAPVMQIVLSGTNTVAATDMTKTDSTHYTYTHLVGAGNGTVTVALVTGVDVAGNPIVTAPTGGATFTVDNTLPTLSSVSMVSNNTNNAYAKTGNVVTLTFTASETLGATPTVTIAGSTRTVTPSGNNYSATYTFAGTETEGTIPFTVDFADVATNAGTQVTEATSGVTTATYDKTSPTLNSFTSTTVNGTYGPAATINITANYNETIDTGSTMTVVVNTATPVSVVLSTVSGSTLSGTYTVGAMSSGQNTLDLSIASITSQAVVDMAGNSLTATTLPATNIAASRDIVVSTIEPDQVLLTPSTTLSPSTTEVVVTNSGVDSTITVPSTVTNPTLDLTSIDSLSGANRTATLNNALTINTNTGSSTLNIQIPAGVTITGDSTNWTGIVNAPTLLATSTVQNIAPKTNGADTNIGASVEVGFGDVPLTLSNAVRLLIPGQAGKSAGYVRGSTFTAITETCAGDSQVTNDTLAPGAECKMDVGPDLVIWTKHFTKFVSYTLNSFNSGSSSSGGSSGSVSCSEPKAGGAPRLLSATSAGSNSVTLTWSAAPSPVTHYVITYGLTSGAQSYGNPNVGNTTSYTVNHLSGGTTYYFRVRAGNGCNGGDYSNEIAANPSGGAVTGIASGFAPGVLGVSKKVIKQTVSPAVGPTNAAPEQAEVKGTQTIPAVPTAPVAPAAPQAQQSGGFFSAIGRFFSSLFGR